VAELVVAGYRFPYLPEGGKIELRYDTRPCFRGPAADHLQLAELLFVFEYLHLVRTVELSEAEVVVRTEAEGDLERGFDAAFQEGDIFLDELGLQRLRVGGDEDALFRLHGPGDERDEIGHAFAHAGAGLDQEMARAGDGFFDSLGHRDLFLPLLVSREVPGELAPAGEEYAKSNIFHGKSSL